MCRSTSTISVIHHNSTCHCCFELFHLILQNQYTVMTCRYLTQYYNETECWREWIKLLILLLKSYGQISQIGQDHAKTQNLLVIRINIKPRFCHTSANKLIILNIQRLVGEVAIQFYGLTARMGSFGRFHPHGCQFEAMIIIKRKYYTKTAALTRYNHVSSYLKVWYNSWPREFDEYVWYKYLTNFRRQFRLNEMQWKPDGPLH